LGGFILYQLQRIPTKDETFYYENLEFTVVSAVGPRLHQIQVRRLQ
jgi:CBS domain containing-hemolysin-like protein